MLREQRQGLGPEGEQRAYDVAPGRLVLLPPDAMTSRPSPMSLLRTMLLPKGFPSSVCPEYVRFQLWDTLQEACGYFRSILTSRAWLTGLGVGDGGSDVVSALTNTMVVEYFGMVCGLLCATPRLVTLFATDMKKWRMAAEVLGLLSSLLTVLAGAHPRRFLALSCAAGAVGALGSVAGSVSRAPLVSHLARARNEADVSAKEGSQSRLLKLAAIALGHRFLLYVDAEPRRAAAAFAVLAALKVAFQWRATRLLELRTLNRQRLCLLLHAFREGGGGGAGAGAGDYGMTPAAVATRERIFWRRPAPGERLRVGASLGELDGPGGPEAAVSLARGTRRGRRYAVRRAAGGGRDPGFVAVLAKGAGPHDQLRAFLFLDALLAAGDVDRGTSRAAMPPSAGAEDRLHAEVERDFPRFLESLEENGWETDHLLLGDGEWRVVVGGGADGGERGRPGRRSKAE